MKVLGVHDDLTIGQLKTCVDAEDGAVGVLCADGHRGYSMPIGGVVGYQRYVSPSGVGYDIACGNLAERTTLKLTDIEKDLDRLADEIQRRVSFGVGRKNNEPIDSTVFEEIEHSPVKEQQALLKMASEQLGTVGSGNHYVDVLVDESGDVWVACHFGSRGFGHKTATGFMNIAQGKKFDDRGGDGEMDSPPLLLDISTPSGQDYIEAMKIAGSYAYRGREAVVKKVMEILGTTMTFSVHNHHNFAWEEEHGGVKRWVVRKGATPAFPGQYGFVGGSMGDFSVILRGVESEQSRELLYSTVHGAGRVMSRTQAAGKQKWTKGGWACGNYRACDQEVLPFNSVNKKPNEPNPKCPKCGSRMVLKKRSMERKAGGAVDFAAEQAKLTERGIVLRGAGADEAPPVYRPLQTVLDAHAGTIEIVHTLQPKIVVMAGGDEYDPFKD